MARVVASERSAACRGIRVGWDTGWPATWCPPWAKFSADDVAVPMTVTGEVNRQRDRHRDHHSDPGVDVRAAVGVQASTRRSRHPARPIRTTAYVHITANPVHGVKGWATPKVPSTITAPALDGRYCTKWSVSEVGSRFVSGGITKNTATKVVIAAAVFRSNAPNAIAVRPATVRYRAAPRIERTAPGSDAEALSWSPSSAWPTRNDVMLAASIVRNTVPANTANLPHNIGSRLGTTVSEERIIPVLYSPVINSTPRTPTAICAKKVPVSEVEIAVAPGSNPVAWLAVMAANIAPRPIISTMAVSKVETVDRRERNLVHSDSRTRAWVTRGPVPPLIVVTVVAGARAVVMPPPPRWLLLRCRWCRLRGIRRSRWSGS